MNKQLLQITNLNIGYGNKVVFNNANIEICRGQKILISGDSGSGKSVLLRVISGIEPVNNVGDTTSFSLSSSTGSYKNYRKKLPKELGCSMIFQDAVHSLHPYRSIRSQCPKDPKLYNELNLDPAYFLSKKFPKFPSDCSGGECQRLSLLFTLARCKNNTSNNKKLDILLLDEPFTDVDHIAAKYAEKAIAPFFQHPKYKNLTVVLVSHKWENLNFLDEETTFFYRIDKGTLNIEKPPKYPKGENIITAANRNKNTLLKLSVAEPWPLGLHEKFWIWPQDIEIVEGERLGIIGESGSGKTTLLRAAAGLLPQKDYRKYVQVNFRFSDGDRSIISVNRKTRYRNIQIVSQDTGGSLSKETIDKNLERIRRAVKANTKEFYRNWERLARRMRLIDNEKYSIINSASNRMSDISNTQMSKLSMGMARRYMLVMALLLLDIYNDTRKPKLLLLDEISRGLDPANANIMAEILCEIVEKFNITIVAVSHDIDFLKKFCNKFRLMMKGLLLRKELDHDLLDKLQSDPDYLVNPYYSQFLSGEEPRHKIGKMPINAGYNGCLYEYYYDCYNTGKKSQCKRNQLKRDKEVGLCM